MDRPPLAGTLSGNAEKLTQPSYNKLMTRALGPLRIVSVTPQTLTIDKHGIHNKVTADRDFPALDRL